MVIDGETVLTGSFNWSVNAERFNAEISARRMCRGRRGIISSLRDLRATLGALRAKPFSYKRRPPPRR